MAWYQMGTKPLPEAMVTGIGEAIWRSVYQATLTLNTLNYLKDYKRYIHILNLILDLAWPK